MSFCNHGRLFNAYLDPPHTFFEGLTMLRICQGPPGSGKSYMGVNYICSGYAKYDAVYQSWILPPSVLVISNFEDLKISHLNLDLLLGKYDVLEFFTVANFERIQKQYSCTNIILLIDEAQRIFDSKFFNKEVFYFFQYHRHLGVDVFFFTQSITTIARHLIPLCEFIIEACPRSLGIGNTFRYKYKDLKGNVLYSKVLRKKPEIFQAYTSMKVDEIEKPTNAITRWAVMCVALCLVVGFGFKGALAMIKGQGAKNLAQQRALQRKYNPQAFANASTVKAKPLMSNVQSVVPAPAPASSPSHAPVIQNRSVPSHRSVPPIPSGLPPQAVSTIDKVPTRNVENQSSVLRYIMIEGKYWVYGKNDKLERLKPGCTVDEFDQMSCS